MAPRTVNCKPLQRDRVEELLITNYPTSYGRGQGREARSGTAADLAQILDLAAHGGLTLPQISEWRLDGINDALEVLRSGDAPGKCVIVAQS